MAKQTNMVLSEGEEMKFSLDAELFATSSNIIQNAIAKVIQFLLMLIGFRGRARLIVTNQRVVLEQQRIIWWCIEAGASFTTYLPQSVSSVGYAYAPTFLCCLCRKYTVSMNFSSGAGFAFVIKGGEREASDLSCAMVSALTR